MSESELLVEQMGRVLVATINRPQARNAINLSTARAIARAMDRLDDDDSLSVGVITGAGGTFSAGMDLKDFAAGVRPSLPDRGFAGIVARPPDKPLVAAVEGPALAGGFEIALSADIIVASATAAFGLPEVRRGLIASGGALLRLPQRISHYAAMDLILTGEPVDAQWAYRHGLVSRLTPAGHALSTAVEVAERIAANGPLAVRTSKTIVARSADWPAHEFFARQKQFSEPVATSADAREGALAFAEKRAPQWTGR
jgi:enoyl-CoA hydratase